MSKQRDGIERFEAEIEVTDHDVHWVSMEAQADGEWVRYSDHLEWLRAQMARANGLQALLDEAEAEFERREGLDALSADGSERHWHAAAEWLSSRRRG